MPSAEEITRHHDDATPEGASAWVGDFRPESGIQIVAADPSWPHVYERVAATIRAALGERAVSVDHVGSTSVPELAAKPVLDVDVVVHDSADEAAYVPRLEEAGFRLVIREPWWHQHRCLIGTNPRCNVHVFSVDSPEVIRHRMFRDWLRATASDRALYAEAKIAAARAANERGEHVMGYNLRKQAVIRAIYERAFRAAGLLPPEL